MTIEYPVDVENTRWTIYHTGEDRILAQHRTWPVADGGPVPGLDPEWAYLLEIHEPAAPHDPRVEKTMRTTLVDLLAGTCTYGWDILPSIEDEEEYLAHCKRIVQTDITEKRNRVEAEGFTDAGYRYDSDRDSAIRISNAALQAQANIETFSIQWTTQDNQAVTLDGPGMLFMQGAMMSKADAAHRNARMHKDNVEALNNADDVLAYDYSGGWPE